MFIVISGYNTDINTDVTPLRGVRKMLENPLWTGTYQPSQPFTYVLRELFNESALVNHYWFSAILINGFLIVSFFSQLVLL